MCSKQQSAVRDLDSFSKGISTADSHTGRYTHLNRYWLRTQINIWRKTFDHFFYLVSTINVKKVLDMTSLFKPAVVRILNLHWSNVFTDPELSELIHIFKLLVAFNC